VGFGLSAIAEMLRVQQPELAPSLHAAALLGGSGGAFAKYVFNWRVYHPQSRGVGALVITAGLLLATCYVAEVVTSRFSSPYTGSPPYYGRSALQAGCLLWGAAESLVYWRKMRRRLALGLAEPLVANRFLLWGVGAAAAGIGTLVGLTAQLLTGIPPLRIPWVMLSSSCFGLTAAVALWLAFLPGRRYRRLVEGRARQGSGA
jgi:hypothetical protein